MDWSCCVDVDLNLDFSSLLLERVAGEADEVCACKVEPVQAAISVGLWARLIGLSRGDLLTARGGFGFALGWIRAVGASGWGSVGCNCNVIGFVLRLWQEDATT